MSELQHEPFQLTFDGFPKAESHLTRHLFGAMLRRIWALPSRPANGRRVQRTRLAKKMRKRGAMSEEMPWNRRLQAAPGRRD